MTCRLNTFWPHCGALGVPWVISWRVKSCPCEDIRESMSSRTASLLTAIVLLLLLVVSNTGRIMLPINALCSPFMTLWFQLSWHEFGYQHITTRSIFSIYMTQVTTWCLFLSLFSISWKSYFSFAPSSCLTCAGARNPLILSPAKRGKWSEVTLL